jgi:hypothetical protein
VLVKSGVAGFDIGLDRRPGGVYVRSMSIFFGVVSLSVFSFLLVCAVKAWLDASLECE